MAPLLTTPNPQPSAPSFLLQSPKRWSSKHLQMLMLTEQFDLPAESVIEAVYLPTDSDEGAFFHSGLSHVMGSDSWIEFQKLSVAFTQPTKHDILNYYDIKDSIYRQNIFDVVFSYLHEAGDCPLSSKFAAHSLFRILLGSAKLGPRLTMWDYLFLLWWLRAYEQRSTIFGSKIPFKIGTVRGTLRCGGAICRTDGEIYMGLPLVTIWVCFNSLLGLTYRLI